MENLNYDPDNCTDHDPNNYTDHDPDNKTGHGSNHDPNYETFYQEFQQSEKSLRDKFLHASRILKNVCKNSEKGDIKKLLKDTTELRSLLTELIELTDTLQNTAKGFDTKTYFENGGFLRQMMDYCKEYGVNIKGEAPVFEIFPFKLRIDIENQDLYVNRNKMLCMRPSYFASEMKRKVDKYTKSSFNLNQFVNELSSAYDLAVIVLNNADSGTRRECDVLLKDIYSFMAPTQKARREYDIQNFAYDLSRLHSTGIDEQTKDGRRFEFGTSKLGNKLIRILDVEGKEQFLGTIRFFR